MSKQSSSNTSGFGRDEMNALLGGGLSEALTRAPVAATTKSATGRSRQRGAVGQKDVSEMTAAETAEWLRQKQREKAASHPSGGLAASAVVGAARLRTGKQRQYHQLLLEEQQRQQQKLQSIDREAEDSAEKRKVARYKEEKVQSSDNENEDESEFITRKKRLPQPKPTITLAPVGNKEATGFAGESAGRKRQRRYDSSSSSDDSDEETNAKATITADAIPVASSSTTRRNRRHDSDDDDHSSSSSSDSEIDQRRQRLLQQRRNKVGAVQNDNDDVNIDLEKENTSTDKQEREDTVASVQDNALLQNSKDEPKRMNSTNGNDIANRKLQPETKGDRDDSRSSEDTSNDDSSSDSNDSSSTSSEDDSEDEDDGESPLIQPKFVPKQLRRGLTQSVAEMEREELEQQVKLKTQQERRQKESRAMVQQVMVASAQAAPDWDTALEGITGAVNEMPNDSDESEDPNKAQDEWEVRELVRLIADWDMEQERMAEERELARRRKMTDEERLQEDIAAGRYRRPGEQRQHNEEAAGKHNLQRYYHKGAFYMDESEWDQSDVRRKAGEYANAATGADKIDKRLLPKVMQVKKFGFANQNARYKGLAAEDTTDRKAQMLPLDHGKRRNDPKR